MSGSAHRSRGQVETLPSGSLRVKVYAGTDPISGKRLYLDETIPAGPRAAKEAEKAHAAAVRLLDQSDLAALGGVVQLLHRGSRTGASRLHPAVGAPGPAVSAAPVRHRGYGTRNALAEIDPTAARSGSTTTL